MAVLKKLMLTVSPLGGCSGLEEHFLLWECVAFLKELNATVSTCKGVGVLKALDLRVSTLGQCSSLERTDFNSFHFGKVW